MTEKRSLINKLAEIMGSIESVEKTGYNKFHKYSYSSEADIQAVTKNKMADKNLMMIPYEVEKNVREVTTRNGGIEYLFQGTWDFKILDGDSGEEIVVRVSGEGQDVGDKGSFKALTGAHKYALMKLFQISTGDDPERDTSNNQGIKNSAEPISKENAGNIIIPFGKYLGKKLSEVFENDVSYVTWLATDSHNEEVKNAANSLLDAEIKEDDKEVESKESGFNDGMFTERLEKVAELTEKDPAILEAFIYQEVSKELDEEVDTLNDKTAPIYNKYLRLLETKAQVKATQKQKEAEAKQENLFEGGTTNPVEWGKK